MKCYLCLVLLFIFCLIACADQADQDEYDGNDHVTSDLLLNRIPATVLDLTLCNGTVAKVDRYDYLQGDPTRKYQVGFTECIYDLENGRIEESRYDYLMSNSKFMMTEISWNESMVIMKTYDYLQGDPSREYLISRSEYILAD